MQHDIAFLHTSPVHVPTFDHLVQGLAPDLRIRHVVAEDLLADAQLRGAEDPALVERVQQAMRDAASTGATVVVCTCSTIGGAAERTRTNDDFIASRIDRAMADRAVSLGPRVLVVAALESTLSPTAELLRESASALHVEVDIRTFLVPHAWERFLRREMKEYIETIAGAVRAVASGADVVVLAQASMAPAVEFLSVLDCEVLASPVLGVRKAIASFKSHEDFVHAGLDSDSSEG
jgi:hypothetical protein